jgi:hypothetical protein
VPVCIDVALLMLQMRGLADGVSVMTFDQSMNLTFETCHESIQRTDLCMVEIGFAVVDCDGYAIYLYCCYFLVTNPCMAAHFILLFILYFEPE